MKLRFGALLSGLRPIRSTLLILPMLCMFSSSGRCDGDSLVRDLNGDGVVKFAAFGDSITYGIGDGTNPGDEPDRDAGSDGNGGYAPRLSALLGVPVLNSGVPGEELTLDGVVRFATFSRGSDADLILLMEGANDAYAQIPSGQYARSLHKALNVAVAAGRTPVLMTLPVPTADRSISAGPVTRYNDVIRRTGASYNLRVIDLESLWRSSCDNPDRCELYMIPEGLHPNSRGYTVIAQIVAAGLLGIDLSSEGGAQELEKVLGLPEGSIIVRPVTKDS